MQLRLLLSAPEHFVMLLTKLTLQTFYLVTQCQILLLGLPQSNFQIGNLIQLLLSPR